MRAIECFIFRLDTKGGKFDRLPELINTGQGIEVDYECMNVSEREYKSWSPCECGHWRHNHVLGDREGNMLQKISCGLSYSHGRCDKCNDCGNYRPMSFKEWMKTSMSFIPEAYFSVAIFDVTHGRE